MHQAGIPKSITSRPKTAAMLRDAMGLDKVCAMARCVLYCMCLYIMHIRYIQVRFICYNACAFVGRRLEPGVYNFIMFWWGVGER